MRSFKAMNILDCFVGFVFGMLFMLTFLAPWRNGEAKLIPFIESIVKIGDTYRCLSDPVQVGNWFVFLHHNGKTYIVQCKIKPPKKGVMIKGLSSGEKILHELHE